MSDLAKYTDDDIIAIVTSGAEDELKRRGYEFGWYKKEQFIGSIYILVNPAFPGLIKIGYADDVQARIKTLSSSPGVPDPYHCYAIYKVKKRLEDLRLHKLIDTLNPDLRHSKKREFYGMDHEKAYSILSAIAQINGNEDQLIVNPFNDDYFDTLKAKPKISASKKQGTIPAAPRGETRGRFSFKMLNIPVGSTLTYVKDNSITCVTVDEMNQVKYNDTVYTLSGLVKYLKKGGTWQGSLYFTYNGKLLTQIREELEAKSTT